MPDHLLPEDDDLDATVQTWAGRSNDAAFADAATLWGYRFAFVAYRDATGNTAHQGKLVNAVITLETPAPSPWPDGFRPLRGPGASDPEPQRVRSRAAIHATAAKSPHVGVAPRTGDARFDSGALLVSSAESAFVDGVFGDHAARAALLALIERGCAVAIFDPIPHHAAKTSAPLHVALSEQSYHHTHAPEALRAILQAMADLTDHLPAWDVHPDAHHESALWEGSALLRNLLGLALMLGALGHVFAASSYTPWSVLAVIGAVGVALAALARALVRRAFRNKRYARAHVDLSVLMVPFAASVLALGGLYTLHVAPDAQLPARLVHAQPDGSACRVTLRALEGTVGDHTTTLNHADTCAALDALPPNAPVRVTARRGLFGAFTIDAVAPADANSAR